MLDDVPVIDAVVHGFDFDPANGNPTGVAHSLIHVGLSPRDPIYRRHLLSREEFERHFTAEELVSCLFAESQTDIAVYHEVRRLDPSRSNPISPIETGLASRELAPGRVLLYGAVSDPLDTDRSIEEIDELVEERRISGLKFYPQDWNARTRRDEDFLLDDEEVAYPLLEHARKVGVKVIAVHKAMGASVKAYGVADFDKAAQQFPDLNFEIVHAGWAFLEDTVILAERPNIYLNLEGTSNFLGIAPRRFAEVLGRFLQTGPHMPNAERRVLWATGAVAAHPQPYLEMFWNFEMPKDLIDDYGYPPVTKEAKRRILGQNFADMHGLDLAQLIAAIPNDEGRRAQLRGDLAEPWSAVRAAA